LSGRGKEVKGSMEDFEERKVTRGRKAD